MIKASALLVALAIGLLVAGVARQQLADGVRVHRGLCGRGAAPGGRGPLALVGDIRPARGPAGQHAGGLVRAAGAGHCPGTGQHPGRGRGTRERPSRARGSRPPAGRRCGAGAQAGWAGTGGPPRGRAARRAPERPADVVPSPAEVAGRGDEFPAPGRGDDLWERVEEELGSAAKRDTGALSWPATVFPPVLRERAGPLNRRLQARGPGQGEPRRGGQRLDMGPGGWLAAT